MQDKHRFYLCEKDGTLVGLIHGGGGGLSCCGEPMKELIANTSDGTQEKHVPQVQVNGREVVVEVGSTHHPMSEDHSIQWVYLLTRQGGQRKILPVDGKPIAAFRLTDDDQPIAAYAYCNLHGLWKTEL